MSKPPTIIIADDDPTLAQALAEDLQQAGFDVVVAADGERALAEAAARRPALLIADIDLPAGDGLSVQQRKDAMAPPASVPVIYLTADTSPQTRLRAETSGVALLHKPLEFARLRETIAHVLVRPAA